MSDQDNSNVDHEGDPEPGFYLLFTDGNRNPGGAPMIGGLLKYRTKSRRWNPLPDGSFSKRAKGDSIDAWEYEALIEGLKLAKDRHARYLWAYMDRRPIVEQINDPKWKVRPELRPYRDVVWELATISPCSD
jgi:ribonuclease HI